MGMLAPPANLLTVFLLKDSVCTPLAMPAVLPAVHPHFSVQNGDESGTVDEPSNEPQGLQEPETEDIKTVSAGDTIYSSATSFEDLRLSPELLQVSHRCQDLPCLVLGRTCYASRHEL